MKAIDKMIDSFENEEESKKPLDINIIRTTLANNGYSLLRPIGQGGFSSVFLVFSNQYGIEFVVKVSDYKGSKKDSSDEFDLNEINNLINLNHPNIINMYKYFTDDYYLYIVLEYCEGGSLKDIIQKNGRIRSAYLYNYCHQILTALKHCHDIQIAHNDIKPANVLIDKNQRLKLADFGLSKGFSSKLYHTNDSTSNENGHQIGKNGEIQSKLFCGSKPYMAPEIINLTAHDPFKADIWALGVTFYEMATGHLPWKTNDLKKMKLQITVGVFSFQDTKLPSSFCQIVHRMLEVIPSRRPSIDWLLEQPIFNKEKSNHANRISILNKSSLVSSMTRLRTSDRIRYYGSLTTLPERQSSLLSYSASENENNISEPSSPVASNNSDFSSSGQINTEIQNCQIPTSLLQTPDDAVFHDNNDNNNRQTPRVTLNAVPRRNARLSTKKSRSSLPLTKTFL